MFPQCGLQLKLRQEYCEKSYQIIKAAQFAARQRKQTTQSCLVLRGVERGVREPGEIIKETRNAQGAGNDGAGKKSRWQASLSVKKNLKKK